MYHLLKIISLTVCRACTPLLMVVVVVRATAGGARSAALTQHRVGAGGDARWSGQRRAIRTRARAVGKFAAGDNKSTGKM